jgi:hypothetical protein
MEGVTSQRLLMDFVLLSPVLTMFLEPFGNDSPRTKAIGANDKNESGGNVIRIFDGGPDPLQKRAHESTAGAEGHAVEEFSTIENH